MPLTEINVNVSTGEVKVEVCSAEKEAEIRSYWAANEIAREQERLAKKEKEQKLLLLKAKLNLNDEEINLLRGRN